MKNKILFLSFIALVGIIVLASSPSIIFADDDYYRGRTFEVTVTNITPGAGGASGQILNGLTVITHTRNFHLFELGQPASDELAMVAEDALNGALVNALLADRNVCDVQTIGIVPPPAPILPGASATVRVNTKGRCRYLSLAAMLVTTNDAFTALNGVPLFKRGDDFLAPAYDAGSEANTENCEHIPGPPCNNGGIRVEDGAEGYVSIHSGIHGIDDLSPSERDWRNPVAYITTRLIY